MTTIAKALILNKPQAEAVYSAMCALNNVGGVLRASVDDLRIEDYGNGIRITKGLRTVESYADQAAFANTYGLGDDAAPEQTPAPDPAIPCGDGCNYMADPQPDNKYQSKCTRCGGTIPF